MSADHKHEHFKGKDAIGHVAEAQARGIIASKEIHGTEVPGHLSAAADAARDTAVALLLCGSVLLESNVPNGDIALQWGMRIAMLLLIFACGWSLWKFGRSAWLGWSRLERLHRILGQEKWEIEHHRQQEREELKELYAAKGFEGKLLEDVLDVLMADDERLLKVMVEEELGLSLQSYEHPLKQGFGALVGCLLAIAICILALVISIYNGLNVFYGFYAGAFLVLGIAGAISARLAENRLIPAVVWNVGLGALALGTVLTLLEYFLY